MIALNCQFIIVVMKYDGEDQIIEMGGIVNKQSKTGLSSNKRLLVLKGGCLYYYSVVPKAFKGDLKILKSLKDGPKAAIQTAYIHYIKADPKNPHQFQIQFEAKHMMQTDEIRKTLTIEDYNFAPKNTNSLTKWRFSTDKKQDRDKWTSSLQGSIKESVDLVNFMKKMNGEKIDDSGSAPRKSFIPWKEDKKEEDQYQKRLEEVKMKKVSEEERKKKLEEDKKKDLEMKSVFQKMKKDKQAKLAEEKAKAELEQKKKEEAERKAEQEKKLAEKKLEEQKARAEKEEEERHERQNLQQQQNEKTQQGGKGNQGQQKDKQQKQKPQKEKLLKQKADQQKPLLKKTDEQKKPKQGKPDLPSFPPPIPQLTIPKASEHDRFQVDNSSSQSRQYRAQQPTVPLHEFPTPRHNKQQIEQQQSVKQFQMKQQTSSPYKRKETAPTPAPQKYGGILEYYKLMNDLFTGNFKDRLHTQVQLRKVLSSFRDRSTDIFQEIINQLLLQPTKRTFYANNSKKIEFQNMEFRIGMTNSKKVTINSIQSFFFDSKEQKVLRKEFQTYEYIQKQINKLRKEGSQITLRVPLMTLIEYKGVIGLANYVNRHEVELKGQQQKDLIRKECATLGLNEAIYSFKRLPQLDSFIVYLKDPEVINKQKLKIEQFSGPVTQESLKHLQSYSRSLKTLIEVRQQFFSQPLTYKNKEIINSLEYCIYCKALRKVYRSGQGELDQLNFWTLVFSHDQTLIKMVKDTGCQYIPQNSGIFLQYVRLYFGTTFQFLDPHNLKTVTKAKVRPLTKIYSQTGLELQDTIGNFSKYLKEGKFKLAQQALDLSSEVMTSKFQQRAQWRLLLKLAELQYAEGDIIESIKNCKKALQQLPVYDIGRFRIYSLLLKTNQQTSQAQMLKVFKQAIELISINFSGKHTFLITLYCIMAHYFHSRKKDYTNALKMYTAAMALAQQLFGDDSLEVVDIYVDLSRMYLNSNRQNQAFKWNNSAQAIFSKHPEIKAVKFLIHSANLFFSTQQLKQAYAAITRAVGIIDKSPSPNPNQLLQIYKISLELFTAMDDDRRKNIAFEKIFQLGLSYSYNFSKNCLQLWLNHYLKNISKANLKRLIQMNQQISSLSVEEDSVRFLEAKKRGYNGIAQLLEDIFETLGKELELNTTQLQTQIAKQIFKHVQHILGRQYLGHILSIYQ